jgi:hypothetical protein
LDTSPEADAAQVDAYRRLSGAERVAITYRLNESVRALAVAGIRARHPSYDQDHVHRALVRLLFGDSFAREIWPDEPLVDP